MTQPELYPENGHSYQWHDWIGMQESLLPHENSHFWLPRNQSSQTLSFLAGQMETWYVLGRLIVRCLFKCSYLSIALHFLSKRSWTVGGRGRLPVVVLRLALNNLAPASNELASLFQQSGSPAVNRTHLLRICLLVNSFARKCFLGFHQLT